MDRNIERHAALGSKIVEKKDLTFGELRQLQDMATDKDNPDALMDAIITAFHFGVAVGEKQKK